MMNRDTLPTIRRELSPVMKLALSISIASSDDYTAAQEELRVIAGLEKKMTAEKERMLTPLRDAMNVERKRWKPLEEELTNAKSILKEKMVVFVEEDKERMEKEEEKILVAGYKREETVLRKISEVQEAVSSGVRVIKELHISNEFIIPRAFLVPDTKAIIEHLKSGGEVTGCELVDKITVVTPRQ